MSTADETIRRLSAQGSPVPAGTPGSRCMFRYEVPLTGECQHPLTSDPACVANSAHPLLAEFWAEYDPSAPAAWRTFQVFGTGHPLPANARYAAPARAGRTPWFSTCTRSSAATRSRHDN